MGPKARTTHSDVYIIRIPITDRARQWWHARCDRRRGLPHLIDGRPDEVDTPHAQRLRHEGADAVESVRQNAIGFTRENRAEIARLRRQVEEREQQISVWKEELTAAAPSEDELTRRSAGEAAGGLPEDIVRARRTAEAAPRQASIRAQITGAEQANADVRERIALLEADVTAVTRRAQAIAARVDAHTDARLDCYWRTLVRRHPQGRQIASLLRPPAADHGWITDADPWSVLNNKSAPQSLVSMEARHG